MTHKKTPLYAGPDTTGRKSLMSKAEIKIRFDNETASVYSQKDPAWLPEFRYAFGLVCGLAEPFTRTTNRVLDLGAGTGNLSRAILEHNDRVFIDLMDFSPNMLDEAPNTLARHQGRYKLINADFMVHPLGNDEYGAIISSFAIHHSRGEAEYLGLYRKIYGSLCASGIFICCDVVSGDNQFLSELNENGWISFLREQGFAETAIEKIISNYHVEDSPVSVRNHIELLLKAGFTHADVIWKKANFALYVGIKQS